MFAVLCIAAAPKLIAADRPNIVWIISEDTSKHSLQHFDNDGVQTPSIESLADHGITFDRAFSNAPVCSVARTTLITASYAPRLNTQFHRALRKPSLAESHPFFPEGLRRDGYYTTNRGKMDSNAVLSPEVWDQSSADASWKNRPSTTTPFFHVQTIKTTHESQFHFDRSSMKTPTKTDPQTVTVPPYLVDSPIVRYTIAKMHDQTMAMDAEVGQIMEQLRQDDVLEDTFVFFFGDHGGVLPRSKGYLFETGLHVPLVVRIPENFADAVDRDLGSRTNGFVEFVDFGPTVLRLAGSEISDSYDGKPFLGDSIDAADVDSRNETIGYADRMDEKCDLSRSLRIGDLKYIRHFEPMYPDGSMNSYRYKMLAYQEWQTMFDQGELDSTQSSFFEPKPNEALYDLSIDPHETNNLASDDSHRGDLLRLRWKLMQRLRTWPDLSFMTESYLVDDANRDPVTYGESLSGDISRYIDTANLCLQPYDQVERLLVQSIDDADPLVRYWAINAAISIGPDAADLLPKIQFKMLDVEPFIVAKAIEFAAMHGAGPPQGPLQPDQYAERKFDDVRPYLYRSLNRTLSETEALLILRTAVYLAREYPDEFPLEMKRAGLDMLRPRSDALSMDSWNYLQTLHAESSQ